MHFDKFIETLPVVLYGMVGIFIVIGIVFLTILALGKLFKNKDQ